jgi:hypothetical protein
MRNQNVPQRMAKPLMLLRAQQTLARETERKQRNA